MLKSVTYYTFQEVLHLYPAREPSAPHATNINSTWFTSMLSDAGLQYQIEGIDQTAAQISALVNSVITEVYNRHAYDYFFKWEGEWDEDHTLVSGDFILAMRKLINVINLTAPRYIPMLKAVQGITTNPIGKISSTTTGDTRFNDTPQDSGDFNDGDHSTNVSHSVSSTEADSGSIMYRVDEMYKNLRSVILEWSNEFNQLFFTEEDII